MVVVKEKEKVVLNSNNQNEQEVADFDYGDDYGVEQVALKNLNATENPGKKYRNRKKKQQDTTNAVAAATKPDDAA